RGVHARRDQTCGRRVRARREAAGAAHGEAAARLGGAAVAARRRRRARRRDLPRPLARPRSPRGRRAGNHEGAELADLPGGALIAHLRGRISEKHPNRVVVDVSGVGYEVFVPLSTFYGLGDSGADVTLRTYTHVREDALQLYGFATLLE